MNVQSLLLAQGVAPFTPLSISGCKMWLKASSLALADGDPVATWTDLSGNSNSGSASGTARPTYKTSILNGKAIVRFDGTTDVMTTPYTFPSTHTVYVVYNRTAFSPIGNTTANGPLWRSTTLWSNVNDGTVTTSTTIYTGAFVYLGIAWNGNNVPLVRLNGSNIYSSKSGTSTAAAGATQIGRSFDGFFGGDIAEVIVYDSQLSVPNCQLLEGYIVGEYAI